MPTETTSSLPEDPTGSRSLTCLPKIPSSCPSKLGIEEDEMTGSKYDVVGFERRSISDNVDRERGAISSDKDERAQRRKGWIQFITLCWVFVLEGWNDSSLGPLLPGIQKFYKINYTVASFLFFFLCVGFMLGAITNVYVAHRFGFGKTILLGTVGQIVAYSLIIPAPPFPVIVFAFTVYGFFTMMQNSQVNSFVAGLHKPSRMAVLHAVYGIGAFSSPFVSSIFASTRFWHFYYFTTLALAITVAVALLVVFRLKTRDELYISCGIPVQIPAVTHKEHNIYRQLCGVRAVYILSLFSLAYVGLEITIGGWTVTYLIHRTGAGEDAGYVSFGFFAGIAIGRLLFIPLNRKVGERRIVLIYAVIALILEAIIWAIPAFIPTMVLVSVVGLVLGPMFPILMNQCGAFFPPHLLSGGIGCVVGCGTLGGAIMPFVTGALADRYGVTSMQPLLLSVIAFMTLMWAGVVYDNRYKNQSALSIPPI